MPLSSDDRRQITRFREEFERSYARDDRFIEITHDDRPDESTLATRFKVAPRLWLEFAVRPLLPQIRAGILTDDRWISEELEEAIESTGDDMSEFVEAGFDEVGLNWTNPPVEHYREGGKYFYFATAFDLGTVADLANPDVGARADQMFEGYYEAFRNTIEKQRNLAAPAS